MAYKAKKEEKYIIVTCNGDYGEVFSIRADAERELRDLLDGRMDADDIHVYKGVEISFTHGVSIKE